MKEELPGPLRRFLRFRQIPGHVFSLPDERRMRANLRCDCGLFGEQQFRLVFALRHGREISGFAVVIENAFEKGCCCGQHLNYCRPVVRSQQGVEKTFDLFRVHFRYAIDCIHAEVPVHGAAEKHGKFPEKFRVIDETGFGEPKKVIEIAGMATVDHGFDFAGEQFLGGENERLARLGIGDGCSGKHSWCQGACAHQEVDLHLDAVTCAGMIGVAEVPFPQSMIIGAVLDLVSEADSDLFDSLNNVRALAEHFFAIDVRDVVQIDVHGEACQVEVEQVERGAALENEFVAKEGMFVKLGEQFSKTKELLEVVGLKAGCFRERMKSCGIEFHVRMRGSAEGASVSGTMSLQVGTQRFPGRLLLR